MSDTTLSKEEKQYKRLTEEPVARLVLELGLPTTISMLITNLYNMVDTWFVSQLASWVPVPPERWEWCSV